MMWIGNLVGIGTLRRRGYEVGGARDSAGSEGRRSVSLTTTEYGVLDSSSRGGH